jgi:hypothetical protein
VFSVIYIYIHAYIYNYIGWYGFTYECVINDVVINESTKVIDPKQAEVFTVKIMEITFTPSETDENELVAWYVVYFISKCYFLCDILTA